MHFSWYTTVTGTYFHLQILDMLTSWNSTVRAPIFDRHQFFGTSEHYGKAHGSLLSGWINYDYTACCWFPTSSNILDTSITVLTNQVWKLLIALFKVPNTGAFTVLWIHDTEECRFFFFKVIHVVFSLRQDDEGWRKIVFLPKWDGWGWRVPCGNVPNCHTTQRYMGTTVEPCYKEVRYNKPSYYEVTLLVPALYNSLTFYPYITRNLI